MYPVRTAKWDGEEKWECRHAHDVHELCKRIDGAHVRDDRDGWCGCDDYNHHIEDNGADR
jgi:hypothetical protein